MELEGAAAEVKRMIFILGCQNFCMASKHAIVCDAVYVLALNYRSGVLYEGGMVLSM